ncbi:modifier of mdg4-like isoform X10 [Anopheles ziemanni]|uniref:modifier of mdg4-like isoform X22 n=1 Tax=Anopheles coustani TaxID=139045 RepID=UPI00265A7C54|nr:modifier of mdg4-like isoform X22 [Anopheles coustani]XP_058170968.1 modifier of mdg4-like isoform X10 [Anopheles ziemanni]
MADDEQFSLCWNNFNTNLSAGFHESLLRGDLVDVTLAAEGQLVKAHRLILSVCSPYFRKMLTQVPATQHAFIFLKDVSHSALKDLIQFMYCGEVNVKQDALPAFISTAEALQIKGLTETGDSAPAQQSPAKEVIAAPPATISVPIATATGGSPRTKVQRTRVHSYKLESEESGDDKVQIQAGSSHHVTAQQVQQQTQHTTTQKRTLQQRTVIPIQPSKRTKLSVASVEALEAPEATPQVQTVQIVKQVLEPDYVEIPIESINAKAEPEYADETGEIETVETEAEQEHTLTEHEQSVEQEQADDDGNYVEDEYAEMGKFEESYFTEGEDAKAGASGFGDSYTSDGGTGTEQSAQVTVNERRGVQRQPQQLVDLHGFECAEEAQFGVSQRGALKLIYHNFEYIKDRDFPESTNWRCALFKRYHCRARAITRVINDKTFVRPTNHVHCHSSKDYRKARKAQKKPNLFERLGLHQ